MTIGKPPKPGKYVSKGRLFLPIITDCSNNLPDCTNTDYNRYNRPDYACCHYIGTALIPTSTYTMSFTKFFPSLTVCFM